MPWLYRRARDSHRLDTDYLPGDGELLELGGVSFARIRCIRDARVPNQWRTVAGISW